MEDFSLDEDSSSDIEEDVGKSLRHPKQNCSDTSTATEFDFTYCYETNIGPKSISLSLDNRTATERDEATIYKTERVSRKDGSFFEKTSSVESNNGDVSKRVLVYQRVSFYENDDAPIDKDNLYDLEITSLGIRLEDALKQMHDKILKTDLHLKIEMIEKEKEKLRPLFKTYLNQLQFNVERDLYKLWQMNCEEISTKLVDSSLNVHIASSATTTIQNNITNLTEKLFIIIENEVLQVLHDTMRPSVVSEKEGERYMTDNEINQTVINEIVSGIIGFLLDDTSAIEYDEATSTESDIAARIVNYVTVCMQDNGMTDKYSTFHQLLGDISISFVDGLQQTLGIMSHFEKELDLECDIDQLEKVKPILKPALDQYKFTIQQLWLEESKQIPKELDTPSPLASPSGCLDKDSIYIPPPIQKLIEQIYITFQNLLSHFFLALISPLPGYFEKACEWWFPLLNCLWEEGEQSPEKNKNILEDLKTFLLYARTLYVQELQQRQATIQYIIDDAVEFASQMWERLNIQVLSKYNYSKYTIMIKKVNMYVVNTWLNTMIHNNGELHATTQYLIDIGIYILRSVKEFFDMDMQDNRLNKSDNVTAKPNLQWSKSEQLIIQMNTLGLCKTSYSEYVTKLTSNANADENLVFGMKSDEFMKDLIGSFKGTLGEDFKEFLLDDNALLLKCAMTELSNFQPLFFPFLKKIDRNNISTCLKTKISSYDNIQDMQDSFAKLWYDITNILEIEDQFNSNNNRVMQTLFSAARLSGSALDGVSTAKWFSPNTSPEIEMDFMYEFGVYPKELKFLFQPIKGKDVFVKVISNRIHEKTSIFTNQSQKLSAFGHANGFLDSSRFKKNFLDNQQQMKHFKLNKSLITQQISKNVTYYTNFKTKFEDAIQYTGKAGTTSITTIKLDNNDFTFSLDKIPCLRLLFWPSKAKEWLTHDTEWLTKIKRLTIAAKGCHLVPKASSDGNQNQEWRLSFSIAENELFGLLSVNQKVSFYLFKVLFYMHIRQIGEKEVNVRSMKLRTFKKNEHEFHSYMIKTLMLRACDEFPPNHKIWKEENFEEAVQQLLSRFADALKTNHLPHYFVPTWNLLCDVGRGNRDIALDQVNCMSKSLVNYIPHNVQQACNKMKVNQKAFDLIHIFLLRLL